MFNASQPESPYPREAVLKQQQDIANKAFIILRKLAIIHPSLLIRYLPTVTSLIEIKTDMSLIDFVRRQYHILYVHMLGILDALRPQIFQVIFIFSNTNIVRS